MLHRIRAFFDQRNVLEVETPALSIAAISDPAIQSIPASIDQHLRYLHTSPELAMKRLLASGSGDIYQICKVFRAGEAGRYHNLEFTLLEWYRLNWDAEQLQAETVSLIQTVAEHPLRVKRLSYAVCFEQALGIDPLTIATEKLEALAKSKSLLPDSQLSHDSLLDLLFSMAVVSSFADQQLTIVYDYPASQAALARLNPDRLTAARFEIFWGQTELANGYHELTDSSEQQQRFERDNILRRSTGQPVMPLDKNFLASLQAGLPDCAGVALGLDRVLMKVTGQDHIDKVICFPANRA